ncbi:MAG TPA: ABC transporter permease [Actinomycetota bacterium]
MRTALAIAGKDLRRRIRDRTAVLIAIILPFGLAWIFSLTLGAAGSGDFEATLGVANEDGGGHLPEAFGELVARIDSVTLREVGSAAEAEHLIRAGTVDTAVVFPSGFTAGVESGRGGRIDVIGSPDASIASLITVSLARSFASGLDAVSLSIATSSTPGTEPDPAFVERARAVAPPATIGSSAAADTAASPSTFFAIGMAVFFLFFTVEFGVRGLLEEREGGTLARLLVAPVRPSSVLAGKALASLAMGLVSTTLLVLASSWLLDADWGDPLGVVLLVLGGVLAAVGVTSLVATLATTTAQAGAYVSIVAVVGGLLGGTFFPISEAGVFGAIRFLSPQGWLMEGFQTLSYGGSLGEIRAPLLGVTAIAIATGAIASIRARGLVAR